MKNIIFFIQNISRPAGSERVTSIIASELAERGYGVSIVSICGNNTCYYPLNSKIKLYTLFNQNELDNRKFFLKVLNKLNSFYKHNKIDVCIDVFAALSIYTLIMKVRYRFKNVSWEHFNYKINTGMNKLGRKLAIRFSDAIVTLTNTDKNYYTKNNIVKGIIMCIYNPSPYQNVSDRLLNKEKIIISVGRLNYQKGFDRLVKLWSIVENKTNWQMLIFGEGEELQNLQELILKMGLKRIKLMGATKNIDYYYSIASLYISTARFEGLPMTMIEAQSFGLPIISFDYDTGPREIIKNNINGIIVQENTESKLIYSTAYKLLGLLNSPEVICKMSIASKKSSVRFSTKLIIDKWDNLLKELTI